MKTKITPLDIIVLICLLLVSLSGWVLGKTLNSDSSTVIVEVDGKKQYILDLKKEGIYKVQGPLGITTVEIRNGKVRVKDSPCPRKYCVKQGWIKSGAIICVPNKVVVTAGTILPQGVDAISE